LVESIVLPSSVAFFQASANEKKRNFTETVEAHVMLGVDPRRGDQVCCTSLEIP
jgi:ribosomal protein L1